MAPTPMTAKADHIPATVVTPAAAKHAALLCPLAAMFTTTRTLAPGVTRTIQCSNEMASSVVSMRRPFLASERCYLGKTTLKPTRMKPVAPSIELGGDLNAAVAVCL